MKIKIFITTYFFILVNIISPFYHAYAQEEILVDIDSNIYQTIKIGTQTWMAQNLRTTRFNNCDTIPLVTDGWDWSHISFGTPAYCWYANDKAAMKNIYGALYNYVAAIRKNICPINWHVPTNDDWKILSEYLVEDSAGCKLKEAGTIHWWPPNLCATNESGFTGLPGGLRTEDGRFLFMGDRGVFWATEGSEIAYNIRELTYKGIWLWKWDENTQQGFSIRCIKD
jgi:uncharacterized protein (TIGR02145 family)